MCAVEPVASDCWFTTSLDAPVRLRLGGGVAGEQAITVHEMFARTCRRGPDALAMRMPVIAIPFFMYCAYSLSIGQQ